MTDAPRIPDRGWNTELTGEVRAISDRRRRRQQQEEEQQQQQQQQEADGEERRGMDEDEEATPRRPSRGRAHRGPRRPPDPGEQTGQEETASKPLDDEPGGLIDLEA